MNACARVCLCMSKKTDGCFQFVFECVFVEVCVRFLYMCLCVFVCVNLFKVPLEPCLHACHGQQTKK